MATETTIKWIIFFNKTSNKAQKVVTETDIRKGIKLIENNKTAKKYFDNLCSLQRNKIMKTEAEYIVDVYNKFK